METKGNGERQRKTYMTYMTYMAYMTYKTYIAYITYLSGSATEAWALVL